MSKYVVVEYLTESMVLLQIHIVEADSPEKAMQKTVEFGNNFAVIDTEQPLPYKYFRK